MAIRHNDLFILNNVFVKECIIKEDLLREFELVRDIGQMYICTTIIADTFGEMKLYT